VLLRQVEVLKLQDLRSTAARLRSGLVIWRAKYSREIAIWTTYYDCDLARDCDLDYLWWLSKQFTAVETRTGRSR